jgi:hypothetical protein
MATETYWVSFATGEKFLGVAIVDVGEGADYNDILVETVVRGCNPGDGAVRMTRIPADKAADIPASFKNRLLGQDEVEELNRGGRA